MSAAKTKSDRYGGIISKTLKVRKLINSLFGFLFKAWLSCLGKIPEDPGFYWKRYVRRIRESVRFTVILHPQVGYSGFQTTGMIEWGQKSNPQKISRASSKTQNPWTKIYPPQDLMLHFLKKFIRGTTQLGYVGTIRSQIFRLFWISQKNPYLIKLPKKTPAKISNPKKSWNWKFPTQKNPLTILVTWNPEYTSISQMSNLTFIELLLVFRV